MIRFFAHSNLTVSILAKILDFERWVNRGLQWEPLCENGTYIYPWVKRDFRPRAFLVVVAYFVLAARIFLLRSLTHARSSSSRYPHAPARVAEMPP